MLQHRLSVVRDTLLTCNKISQPTVAHVEWLAPLMGSGYWIAECVEIAGGAMVHGSKGGHSPTLSTLDQLSNAEVVIIAPCGFSIARTQSEMKALRMLESAEWLALDAVQQGRVYVADGNRYFNRSSCCVVETAEIVAEIAWPELAGLWGHHGKHWVRLEELGAFCDDGTRPPTKRGQAASADAKKAKLAALPTYGTRSPAAAHVQRQVDLLREAKFEEAFLMNSAANQARLGSAAQFETVVRSNSSFAALADATNPCSHVDERCEKSKYTIELCVQTTVGENLTFAFEVSKLVNEYETEDAPGFATEGVRVVC